MGYVEKLLAREERIVFATRQHWFALVPTIVVDTALCIVILAASIGGFLISPPFPLFGLFFLLVPLGHFAIRLSKWLNEQYVVTSRRVMEVKGVVRKHVSDSSLEKVNDVVMEQGALGRMLNYGDLSIITGADIGVNTFRRIAYPIRFKVAMLDQKSRLNKGPARQEKSVPELLAQLDELRQRGVITAEEFARQKSRLLEQGQ